MQRTVAGLKEQIMPHKTMLIAVLLLGACANWDGAPNAPSYNPRAAAGASGMPNQDCINRCFRSSGSSATPGDRSFCESRCTY
jgi:hypothetical protein